MTSAAPGGFTIGALPLLTTVPADSLARIEFVTFDCQAAPPLSIVSARILITSVADRSIFTEYPLIIHRQGTLVNGFSEMFNVSQLVRIYADPRSEIRASFIASIGADSDARGASCNMTVTGLLKKSLTDAPTAAAKAKIPERYELTLAPATELRHRD
jgi:hypothetical protein